MLSDPAVAPSGEVTLMFTDIEGSTQLWEKHKEAFQPVLDRHNALIRKCLAAHCGYEVKTIGDSFMAAFAAPAAAAACVLDIQRCIEAEPFELTNGLRVRIGLHIGNLEPQNGDYFGPPVNRAARIEAAGHGGMILLSDDLAACLETTLPEAAVLLDLGIHQLKDLGDPRHIYRLTHPDLPSRDYPKIRTLQALPNNFPAQVTSFVGREHEIEELGVLLRQPLPRLMTLTGPGGTGKTRLSLQVAADAMDVFGNGIWIVELAAVTNPRDVPTAIALALEVPLSGDADPRAQLFAFLKTKRSLLVLDNFEQVVDAARFVSDLLKACPLVKILVTSRHLLQIGGEYEFEVRPLALPPENANAAACLQSACARLFVERAQTIKPNFELHDENAPTVAEICIKLEGLPLAVELTANLIRGLSPQQILPRLEDRFRLLASTRRDLDPRQRSLRGAIDWGYELLREDERIFFAQLSVFKGGFFLQDVEAVCDNPEAFLLAQELRDKSLLRAIEVFGETRFSMLETLREYAREKLEETGELDIRLDAHTKHYLTRAEEWGAQIESSGEVRQRMVVDLDNLRTGMDWADQQADCATVAAYGRALFRFFKNASLYEEGLRRLIMAENACRKGNDLSQLAQLLVQRGVFHFQKSELTEAQRFYRESYEISKQLADKPRMISVLINLGNISWVETDYAMARARYEEALELARETKQQRYEAILLANLGILSGDAGDFAEANRCFDAALALHRRTDNKQEIAITYMHRAELLALQEQWEAALQVLEESYVLFLELGSKMDLAMNAFIRVILLIETGRVEDARPWLSKGLEIQAEINNSWCDMYGLAAQGRYEGVLGNLSQALDCYRRSYEIALMIMNRKHVAVLLRYVAQTYQENNELEIAYRAARLAYREYTAAKLFEKEKASKLLADLRPRIGTEQADRLDANAETSLVEPLFSFA